MSGVILSLQCPKICYFSFLPLRRSHTTFCGSVPRQLIKATSDIQNSKDVLYKKKKKSGHYISGLCSGLFSGITITNQ